MSSPKTNVAYTFYVPLIDSATGDFKANPTIAAGDFKVSTDGGAYANITLPTIEPAGSINVKISLSADEMNGTKITIQCIDVAGGEWDDLFIFLDLDDVNVDDIVRSTTPANTLNVSAGGLADVDIQSLGGSTDAVDAMAALYTGAVIRGTVTAVTDAGDFTLTSANLSGFDNDYNNMWLVFLDNNNQYIMRLITVYVGSSNRVQFTGSGLAGPFHQSVNPGDSWMIISGSL